MIMTMLVSKLLRTLPLQFAHFLFMFFTTSFQYMLDLRKRDHREELGEKEITGKEQAKCSHIESYLPDGGCVISSPCARKVIPVHRSNDDHEALEPHPDIDQDRHKECD